MSHPLGLEEDEVNPLLPDDPDTEEENIMDFPKNWDPDVPVEVEKDTI